MEVAADGAHGGVDPVVEPSFQEVAPRVTIGFAMTDHGLDGRASTKFALDLTSYAALLAGYEDPPRLWRGG